MLQKKMFKVICPMEKVNGGKWWLRCGIGYENKDNSLNLYINALPVSAGKDGTLTLQVRELSDAELRESAERRSTYQARGTVGPPTARGDDALGAPASASFAMDAPGGVPF